jgi:type I restriction enzyme M protein
MVNTIHDFGRLLWEIAGILRQEGLPSWQYVEEFSYFLFLKLFDEKEIELEKIAQVEGKDYTPIIPEKFRFHNWAEAPENWAKSQGYNDISDFLKDMFHTLAKLDKEGNQERRMIAKIFKGHEPRIKREKTLSELVKRIADLKLRGVPYDQMGQAYEYLIQKIGAEKEFSEYFTPRHIVEFMVEIIDPKPGEKIYDPGAGTGGFLVKAHDYVIRQYIDKEQDSAKKEILLRQLRENLYGREKVEYVYRLGLMNLVLHGDGSSNFEHGDSLSAPVMLKERNLYDVVLTNPPFGDLKYEITGTFDHWTKRMENLFLQHVMNAVKPGGRVGIIVPDGVLFRADNAHKWVRRRLIEEFNVFAIVSLPSGVFLPYTGSKTSLLFFEKPKDEKAPRTKKYGITWLKMMALNLVINAFP